MSSAPSSPLPPDTPGETPALSEPKKIVLQDWIAERAKLREGIPDSAKYVGIVLAAIITWAFNLKFTSPQGPVQGQSDWFASKMVLLSGFSMSLTVGFLFRLNEMTGRLKRLNDRINTTLKPFDVTMDDQDMELYRKWVGAVAFFWLFFVLAVCGYYNFFYR